MRRRDSLGGTRRVQGGVDSAHKSLIRSKSRSGDGMRTYAPAGTAGRAGPAPRGAVARPRRRPSRGHRPARDAVHADWPAWLDPRIRGRAREARHRAAVHPPGGRDRGGPRRAGRRRGDARRPRASRCATRCRSSRRWPRTRRRGRCSCSPPRRSARTRSTEFGELVLDAGLEISAACYDGDTPAPDPVRGPQGRAGRGDQPGHAPLGDPPPPHEVVPAVRAAAGHRRRRAAHVPRRVRRRTSRTSCGGCCGCAPTTGPTR